MENQISKLDEHKLTSAIEKAATLASANKTLDRNQVLAEQLKKAHIDDRFVKVASNAFNKRITVLTFKKTDDEHKAETFPLTDATTVLGYMNGDMEKAASEQAPFQIEYVDTAASMQKAASAETKKPLYEDTVPYQELCQHVENVMVKNEAALHDRLCDYRKINKEANDLSDELSDYFQKTACASFEFTTLVNAYGDRFKNAISDKLPKETDYTETAESAILPDTPVYKKASRMIEAHEAAENLKTVLDIYADGISQFCKAASDMGEMVNRMEAGLTKTAIVGEKATGLAKEIGMELGLAPAAIAQYGIGAADKMINGVADTTGKALGNAYALYQAGNAAHMAPHEILDAEFLTKDRYRDRMLGWSDMTADPQFAMYPAEQVFLATQKAMDLDTTLERPDRREVLRSYVAQLLAQNNRLSTADIAALATTLRGLTAADGNAASQIALESVKKMEEKKAPELPSLEGLLGSTVEIKGEERAKDVLDTIAKSNEEYVKDMDKQREAKDKKKEQAETAAREKKNTNSATQQARQNFLTGTMGYTLTMGPKGQITYVDQSGKPHDQKEVEALLNAAAKANLVPTIEA